MEQIAVKHSEREVTLIAQPDDPLPAGKAAALGLQHVLAMDVYIVPFIIASALSFGLGDATSFIQSAFVAAGLATLIQSQLFMRLPVMQGPSFVPIGAVLAIAFAAGGGLSGLSAVIGALIPGAILMVLLGSPTKIFHKLVGRFVPPVVGGTIIIVVGVALMPVALNSSVFAVHGSATVGGNILLAFISAAVLVSCMLTGIVLGARGTWLRLFSVVLALAAGCVAAFFMGQLNFSGVAAASWFSLPRFAFASLEVSFSLPAALSMLIVYLVVLAETTGTWFAIGAVTGKPLSNEQLDRGATGEGIGCLISALLCSTPVTGYSSNAGIIAITGVASRVAFAAAGIFLVVFGLIGKLAAIIASIPEPVIGGVFGVLCVVIAMSGFRVVRATVLNERNMLVIGLPVLMALFATLAPQDFVKTLPDFMQYLLGSSIAFGSVWAIVLHQILPDIAE